VSTFFASPDFRNPYTMQGDLSIDRELRRDLGLTLSYVYSRGVHLFTNRDLNIGAPGPNINYRVNDFDGNQVGTFSTPGYLTANRVDPRYQRVMQIENGGQSWYNAFIAQLNKRFSYGLQGSVAYTWSHAIDSTLEPGTTRLRSTSHGRSRMATTARRRGVPLSTNATV
jgi:hypothetical protein